MSDVVIRVENLGKCYRLQHQANGQHRERYTALREVIAKKARGVFKNLKSESLKSRNGLPISAFQIPRTQLRLSAFQPFRTLQPLSLSAKRKTLAWLLSRRLPTHPERM